MLPTLKYLPVNWIDGMKVNKDHFIAQDNALQDQMKDAIAIGLNSFNYGILPPAPGTEKSLEIFLDADKANLVRVTILTCRAITPAGVRIEINNANHQQLNNDINALKTEYNFNAAGGKVLNIVLSANPFGRKPIGVVNPEENPPRFPNATTEYTVSIIPVEKEQVNEDSAYSLIIGKLKIVNGVAELIDTYIPACATINSHPDLLEMYHGLDKYLSQMEQSVTTIVQKIYQKDQSNDLAKTVLFITDKMIQFLSSNLLYYRWMLAEMPPIYMIEFFARFARVIKNTLDLKTNTGKEQLLDYLVAWSELNLRQGEFENVLNDIVNLEYDHSNLYDSVIKLSAFTKMSSSLFTKLSKLDYIGKKDDPNIIVATRNADKQQPEKKGPGKASIFMD